jgi:hypothetical protein
VQKHNQGSFPKTACPDERSDIGDVIPARQVRRDFRACSDEYRRLFFLLFLRNTPETFGGEAKKECIKNLKDFM